MRSIIFAAFAALIGFTSCNDETKTAGAQDDVAQKNLEISRMVSRAFQTGDVSLVDSAVADDFLDHTDRGDKVGKDSLKAMINMVRTNFKDMKVEVISEAANTEYVFQWLRYTGTSDGTMGMPAGPYDMKGLEISRHKDGKIVEHWAYMDVAEMMKMMNPNANSTIPPMPDQRKDSAAKSK